MSKFYPLSQSQLGVYLEYIQHPESVQYNLPFSIRFSKEIDIRRLQQAILAVINQYPVFHTRVVEHEGELRQYADFSLRIDVPIEQLNEADVNGRIKRFIRPFDWRQDAMVRFLLIETDESVYFVQDIHHLIFDGKTCTVFYDLIEKAYNGAALPEETISLYAYADTEMETFGTPAYKEAAEYYKKQFSGIEMTRIPGQLNDTEGWLTELSAFVPRQLVERFCNDRSIRPLWLFMSAFEIILSRYCRENSVAYTAIYHGRSDKRLIDTLGMFIKAMPLAIHIDESMPVVDFVNSHKMLLSEARRHGIYPFTHFCQHNEVTPEITFSYQGSFIKDERFLLNENVLQQHWIEGLSSQKPLVIIYEFDDKYDIRLRYVDCQYDAVLMSQLVNSIGVCVEQMVASADKCLKEVSIITGKEKENLIALGRGEELVYDQTETFIDLFRKQVALYSDATAVVDEVSETTYAELDKKSDLLAHALVSRGVETDSFVAVMLPRRKEFLVSVLAVFKSGGAYIPLDNDYPTDRLLYMLEDSEAKVLITTRELFEEKQKEGDFSAENILFVDEFNFDRSCEPINLAQPENLAYMIYTSGSTGKPKGVMIEHRAMTSFVHSIVKLYNLTDADRICCHSSFSFDASVEDLYPILAVGGQMHILSEHLRKDMPRLSDYICSKGITGGCYSTQFGVELLKYYQLPVRYLTVGGEKMTKMVDTDVTVYNTYGPTEFTVDATYSHVNPAIEYRNIPIGRPLANCVAFVVDSSAGLLSVGAIGELCLSGTQLARGYWNRPELTAEKFVDCPFIEGQKMYRTGDLARWNENGELEYLGRIDNQVKLRGFRIELGEIESAMSKCAGIQSAVVEVKEISATQHLCGYYTSQETIDEEKLREELSASLTEYMVPTAFMRLEALPLTPNGKVNRKVLPIPEIKAEEIVLPETGKEQILFEIAKDLLHTDCFGVTNDLTRMGLTSLMAIKLVAMANMKGLKLKTNDVLKRKTIRNILSQEMSLGFWVNDYQPDKPVVVVVHGFTNHAQLKPLTEKLAEIYSVLVIEPIEEHYEYIFKGESKTEVVNMYVALIDLLLPKGSKIHSFVGHSYGGELAYRCVAQWGMISGQQPQIILLDTYLNLEEKEQAFKGISMDGLPAEDREEIAARIRQMNILIALADHKPSPAYRGRVLLFKAMLQQKAAFATQMDEDDFTHMIDINEEYWRAAAPQLESYPIIADHYKMMEAEHQDLVMNLINRIIASI